MCPAGLTLQITPMSLTLETLEASLSWCATRRTALPIIYNSAWMRASAGTRSCLKRLLMSLASGKAPLLTERSETDLQCFWRTKMLVVAEAVAALLPLFPPQKSTARSCSVLGLNTPCKSSHYLICLAQCFPSSPETSPVPACAECLGAF